MAGIAPAEIRTVALMLGALCLGALCAEPLCSADQPPPEAVGTIEGDSIAVTGPMSVEMVHGQVKTIVRSGSDVRVKSGRAWIELIEGGTIAICGPAHLSLLKSGGALTVALDTGTVHVHVDGNLSVTIYTPQIQAQPISIGGAAQDVLVGFDTPAAMCVRSASGAVRLEQQLSGQSLLVPQNGDILIANGQLNGTQVSAGKCSCDLPGNTVPQPAPPVEVSLLTSAKDAAAAKPAVKPAAKPPAPAGADPVYQVFMPPLRFDANAVVQPEPDLQTIILVRRARVRPTLIFEGRVEGDPVVAASSPRPSGASGTAEAAAAMKPAPAPKAAPPATQESLVDRVRSYFRRVLGRAS